MAEKEGEKKSWFVAVVLSLFFAGTGFAYLGHYRRFALSLLSMFVAVFLTVTILQIAGISPNTEFGRFALFIVVFSFCAYLAYLAKRVCDGMQGKSRLRTLSIFGRQKNQGRKKAKRQGKKKQKRASARLALQPAQQLQ